jgi:TPR repeat protein
MSPHLSPPRLLSLATFHLQGKWPHDSGHKCASEFKPNLSKGLVLHTRLAKQGCNQSRVALAEYYFTNESTSNYAEMAFYWSRIAAESGHILWLARCYENGVGTTINLEEAIAMYQKPYAGRELSKAATKKIDHLRQRITK